MKKIFSLILVFILTITAKAQIINFPDANFKAKLLAASPSNAIAANSLGEFMKIDTNNNNEIEVSEALQIKALNVSIAEIYDMTGIEYFTNLRMLNCNQNHISVLNVSNLTSLKSLFCSLNVLTNLDLTGLTQLNNLECAENTLTQINFGNATNISSLSCKFNFLNSLEITNLTNLQTLECDFNQLTTLDFSNSSQLTSLSCPSNQFTTLDVSSLVNLINLNCASNQLTTLALNNLNELSILNCGHNQITSLDVSNLNNLSLLNCEFNQINSPFVFSNMTDLHSIYCQQNLIPSITFSETLNLEVIDCSANQISTLDASSLSSLSIINCHDNQLLTNLNIKNGSIEQFLDFSGNQNLLNICADATEITTIENLIADYGYSNCQVNSLCDLNMQNIEKNASFLVYPNPTKNILHLENKEIIDFKSIYIYTLLGQSVMTITDAKNVSTIDVSTFKIGSYFIKIISDKGTASGKFIKE